MTGKMPAVVTPPEDSVCVGYEAVSKKPEATSSEEAAEEITPKWR